MVRGREFTLLFIHFVGMWVLMVRNLRDTELKPSVTLPPPITRDSVLLTQNAMTYYPGNASYYSFSLTTNNQSADPQAHSLPQGVLAL